MFHKHCIRIKHWHHPLQSSGARVPLTYKSLIFQVTLELHKLLKYDFARLPTQLINTALSLFIA